jgi:hypothetical protein
VTTPISRLRINPTIAVRQAAGRIRQVARPPSEAVVPLFRQARVVTVEGGSPPTCTLSYDDVTPGPQVPGIRYADGFVLFPNDLVYTATLSRGDTWVVSKLAKTTLTTPFVQSGTSAVSYNNSTSINITVTWPIAYAPAPQPSPVVIQSTQNATVGMDVLAVCTARAFDSATFRTMQRAGTPVTGTVTLNWMAIGFLVP